MLADKSDAKMPADLPWLNTDNGDFCFMADFVVHGDMAVQDVSLKFFERKDYIANNLGYIDFSPIFPLMFGENEWYLVMRFIAGELTEVYFSIHSPAIKKMTADEYYESGEDRLKFHKQEVRKLCPKPHKFSWGKVDAYWERKSEGTGIYIEYKHGELIKAKILKNPGC